MGSAARWYLSILRDILAAVLVMVTTVTAATAAAAGELKLHGFVLGRGIAVDGSRSWLAGGFGRLTESGPSGAAEDFAGRARGEVQAGLDWRPSPVWDVHVHGLARAEPEGTRGERVGLAEAFLEFRPELSPTTALRFRLGVGFPSASLENTGPLWSSPYTLTLSALDTWIAEELRPAALQATLVRKGSDPDHQLQVGAGLVAGADSSGALLAWRGWTLGDRLVTVGEVLPLPPLASLQPGGAFQRQRDGTTPFSELDGRPGWLAHVRWSHGAAASLRFWALDNLGDRELHRGQYAWRTRLVSAGATVAPWPKVTLIADAMAGRTGMGPADRTHVDIDFATAYVLVSAGGARGRVSARYDVFQNVDRDHTPETNDDDGHAWTLAALFAPAPWVRLALEGVRVTGTRPYAAPPLGAVRRLQAEVRLRR